MQKYLCLILFVFISVSVFSLDVTKYDKIYNALKAESPRNLKAKGEAFYNNGALDSALVCFSIISGSYTPESDKQDVRLYAHAYNRCGVIYLHYNSYTKALNMFLKGLEICEQAGDEMYTARIYNNIANVYYVFHDYRTAESYCEKAYLIGLKYDDKDIQKTLLNNLIGINCYLEEFSKAKKHLNLLKALRTEEQPTFNYYYCISNGALELEEHNYEKAIEWFKKSIAHADSCAIPDRLKYVSYSNIAKTYNYNQEYDSALLYLNKGKEIALSKQNMDIRSECYNDFSSLYEKMGNEELSLFYKRKYLEIADSIFSTQEFGQIKDLQFLHEMDKIEKQVYRLNDAQILKDNQIKSQQRTLMIIICAFVIILALVVIMYIQNRKLREANVELFNKNLEIIRSEENERKQRKYVGEAVSNSTFLQEENISGGEDSETAEIQNNKMKYQSSVINSNEKQRIREAIQEIMDNTLEYCSVDFNLEKLALLANSKSKYVSQVINESYGKNFNLYVNEYRIKEARRRLMDTGSYGNFTIASIAKDVGFKSNANFNLIFKKVTGITPSVYQSMAKKHIQKHDETIQLVCD